MKGLTQYSPVIFTCIFFLFQAVFVYRHSQAIHFGDELEHVSGAWMMVNQGKRLYTDISVNHQPLPFLAGYLLLSIIHPANLYQLIEYLRLLMLLISFVGAVYVSFRFRWAGLMAVVVIETIKYHVFGYHLLGESLAVYPLMTIGLTLYELLFRRGKLTKTDDIVFGMSLFLSVFSLLPNLPLAILSALIYGFYRRREFVYRAVPTFILLFIGLSFGVSWPAWYEETIHNVSLYFLPAETGIFSVTKDLLILIFPWVSLFQLDNLVAQFYFLVFLAGLLAAVRLKIELWKLLLWYGLIISLNLRIYSFTSMGWGGFHLLPQMVLLTSFSASSLAHMGLKGKHFLHVLPLLLLVGAVLITSPWWFERRDTLTDHMVQYNQDEVVGNAIIAMKRSGDTLLSGPQHGEVNLVAGLPFPGRQITYFSWSFGVPRLRHEFENIMNTTPPTFIYFPETNSPYYQFLLPYLNHQYIQTQAGLYVQR